MKPAVWIGALLGGGLGTAAWAAISHYTHMEVGYVAWGIGALVGYLAKHQGGRGKSTAVGCAIISLASILGGKGFSSAAAIRDYLSQEIVPQAYAQLVEGATSYQPRSTDAEMAQFMVQHQFTQDHEAAQISSDEIAQFRQGRGSLLESFAQHVPSLAEFANSPAVVSLRQSALSLKNISSTVKNSLGVLDVVFGALGVATAYQVVAGQEGDDGDDEDEGEDDEDGDDGSD